MNLTKKILFGSLLLCLCLCIDALGRDNVFPSMIKEKLSAIATYSFQKRKTINSTTLATVERANWQKASHFNFGLRFDECWIKFNINNDSPLPIKRYVVLSSMFNDSLILYQKVGGRLTELAITGEGVKYSEKRIKTLLPVFEVFIEGNDTATFYIKSVGIGQLNNLEGWMMNAEAYHIHDAILLMWHGIFYGVLLIACIINMAYFILTSERAYLYFSIQILGSIFTLFYFDGASQKFLFPESGYWGNQIGVMSLVLTFIVANRFYFYFFGIEKKSFERKVLIWLSISTGISGLLSFIYPWGFSLFVVLISIITPIIACFQAYLIYRSSKTMQVSYAKIFISTFCWVSLGTLFQLYTIGTIEDNFVNHHAIHFAFIIQAVFVSLAIGDKLRLIRNRNAQMQQELNVTLKQYSQNLISTVESERQRIASDIHDSLGQNLLVIRNRLLQSLKKPEVNHAEVYNSLLKLTSETLDDARAISYNLRPPILNTMGLTVAIESLIRNFSQSNDITVDFKMLNSVDGAIEKDLEINIYRILQEILNNAIKHSGSSKIKLYINRDDEITIRYEDIGKGFNFKQTNSFGLGFVNIRERLILLGGEMNVDSKPNEGTKIEIKIPTTVS